MKKALCFLFSVACLWAAESVLRPEFPEPQFQREQWLNLNGRWEFEFDDANAGLAENWASGAKKFTRSIVVPYCFESKLSGIGDTSYHPWVWYRRSLSTPAESKGRRLLLQSTASSPATTRAASRRSCSTSPRWRWQTVWIETVAESHIESVRITPTNDGVVRFEPRIAEPQAALEFHVIIRSAGEVVGSAMTRVRGQTSPLITGVASPRLWTPERPTLYDVVFELRRGTEVVDRVSSYFGFRSVSTENGRLLLNGNPIYFKSVLDQGYWPESVLTPPTDEAIQYDIKTTKEMGFNGARKHQKVEDPRYLYWADRLGLLVSGEMANAQVFDEAAVGRFTREWMDVVQRDYNHPSVIIWAPINESWGVPDVAHDPRQQNYIKSLYVLTKTLDNTRLVIDNEGWEHTAMTDLCAVHNYARTGDLLFEAYKDMGGKPGERVPRLVPGAVYNGSPFYLSEFGGIAYIPAGANVPAEAWGYSGVEKTADDALARLRGLYEALRKMPNFIGICYTQLTDVEQEVNGLMTYDRKPKFDSKALRDMNQMLR